jgi:hypothetical protein
MPTGLYSPDCCAGDNNYNPSASNSQHILIHQSAKKEKELGMGFCPTGTMRLRGFVADSLERA